MPRRAQEALAGIQLFKLLAVVGWEKLCDVRV